MNRSPERNLKGTPVAENVGVKSRSDLSSSEVVLAAARAKTSHVVDLCEVVLAADADATNPVAIDLIADDGTTETVLYRYRFGKDQKAGDSKGFSILGIPGKPGCAIKLKETANTGTVDWYCNFGTHASV